MENEPLQKAPSQIPQNLDASSEVFSKLSHENKGKNPRAQASPSAFSLSSVTWSMAEAFAKAGSFYPPALRLFEEQKRQWVQAKLPISDPENLNQENYLAAAQQAQSEGQYLLAHWIYDQAIEHYEALGSQESFKEAWEALATLYAAKGRLHLTQGNDEKARVQAMLGLSYLETCGINFTENPKQIALKIQLQQLKGQALSQLTTKALDPSQTAPIGLESSESFCHSTKWTSGLSVGFYAGLSTAAKASPSMNPWVIGAAFLGGGISGYFVGAATCDMVTEYAQDSGWVESPKDSVGAEALASGVEFSINGIFVYLSTKIPPAQIGNGLLKELFGVTIEGLFLSAGDVLAESTAESVQDQLLGKESPPAIWERFYEKLMNKLPKGFTFSFTLRLAQWFLTRGRARTHQPGQKPADSARTQQGKTPEGALVPTSPKALAVQPARAGGASPSPSSALAKMGVGTEGPEAAPETSQTQEVSSLPQEQQAVPVSWIISIDGRKPNPQDPDYHPSYRFNGFLAPENQKANHSQEANSIYSMAWRIVKLDQNQARLECSHQGKTYQAEINAKNDPDLGSLSDYEVGQVVVLLKGVQGGLGPNLDDITPEMAQAYYSGEEIFGIQMPSIHQTAELKDFRKLRDRFIKLANQLENFHTARRLAWMEELRFQFPSADSQNLMAKVDMTDQTPSLETMAKAAGKFPLDSQYEQSRSQLLTELADVTNLSYYDLVYFADRYVYLATCSLGECSEEYQALEIASKYFPGILMEPAFSEEDIEILNNRWATGHHPLYLLRSNQDPAKIDDEWMDIPEAYRHDKDHTNTKIREYPNHHRHLSHRIQEMEARLDFLAFTESQTWAEAKLLEIFWFEAHHDNSDSFSDLDFFLEHLLEPLQEALEGPDPILDPQQSLDEIYNVWKEREGFIQIPYIRLIAQLSEPSRPYHRYLQSRQVDTAEITAQELLEAMESYADYLEKEEE